MDRGLAALVQGEQVAGAPADVPVVAAPSDPFAAVPDELRGLSHG